MSSIDELDDLDEGKNDIDLDSQSDIKSDDNYSEDDYYNDAIEEYKKAEPLPSIDHPKGMVYTSKKPNSKFPARLGTETFMNFNEKFQKIKNEEPPEEEFPACSAEEMCENYKITLNLNIDYSSNNYDTFSKNHLRNTLIEQIKKIDWTNETQVNDAKKATNAYEDIKEIFFDKKTAYQLSNINYLFNKKLIEKDNLYEGIPVFIVGDNGGLTDFVLYYTIYKGGYLPKIFVIPEKNNSIKTAKFRKEIVDKKDEQIEILKEFYQENKDLDENTDLSVDFINNIANKIDEKNNGYKVNLYIARKVIKFDPNSSQEIKYKKFLLINILLALKVLSKDGNFVIKLYDTFTPFTIGLIYIIFKNFENVSIFKPVSTRQYSPCRYLVAENYADEGENSIKYLEKFLTKYIEYTKNNYDVKYFLPMAELRKNENFLKIIPEINNGITEKRIDALQEITNFIEKRKTNLYDKMAIKKFFLDNWGLKIINYDEKLLLKNQNNRNNNNQGRNYNYNAPKRLTEEELAEVYKNVGKFDDDQQKMLDLMKQTKPKPKKKVKKESEYKPYEDWDKKYERVSELFKKKKNTTPSKQKKETNKKKKDEDYKKSEFLNKKTERSDKKVEKKSKKSNYEGKSYHKDKDKDNGSIDFNEENELLKIDEEVLKKLNKYKKKE